MSGSLGDLVVSIAADIAKLELGMTRAEHLVAQTAQKIDRAAEMANNSLKGLAAGFVTFKAVDAFASAIEDAIKFSAEMHDMAQKVGTTAAELSSFKTLAAQTGTNLETVGKGMQSLSKAMYETAQGTGKAREVFESLKLEVKDGSGHLKKASDFMVEVGAKLGTMGTTTERTASAMKMMKGAGGELIPFLVELGEKGKQAALISNQQAMEADRYKDKLEELHTSSLKFSLLLAQQVTPVMEAVVATMLNLKESAGGLNDTTRQLAAKNEIRQWAVDAVIGVTMLIDGLRYVKFGVVTIGEALIPLGVVGAEVFQNIGTAIGIVLKMGEDLGLLLQGIMLTMSGQYVAGSMALKEAMANIAAGGDQMAQTFRGSMKNVTTAWEGFTDSFEQRAKDFGSGSITEKFLDQLAKLETGFKKVGKEGEGTGTIVKKFEKDAIMSLTLSLSKDVAQLQVNLESLRKYGIETKATAAAQMELQLAEMARNGTLAEHAKKTGESAEATRARLMGMAQEKDLLTELIKIEVAYVNAVAAHHKALADGVQRVVDQIEEQRILNETYGMTVVQLNQYSIAELRRKQAMAEATEGGHEVAKALQLQIEKMEKLGKLQSDYTHIRDMATAWQGLADIIGTAASKAVTDWGGAVDYLRDQFKQLLLEMVKIFAVRWILNLGAQATGSGSLATLASSYGSGSTAGGIMSALSTAGTAGSALSWLGGTSVGGSVIGAAGNFQAGYLAAQQGMTLGAGAPAAQQLGASAYGYAGVAGIVAVIVAGMLANDAMFQRGWRADNQDTTNNIGGAMGSVNTFDSLLRGIGMSDRLASVISGSSLNARFWGHGARHDDAMGVMGNFSGTGLNVQQWQDYSRQGGVFRSDIRGTDHAPLTDSQKEFFDSFNAALQNTTNLLGSLLNIDVSAALSNYAHEFNMQLTDNGEMLDPAKMSELFSNLFGTVLQEQVALLFDASEDTELAAYVRDLKGTGAEVTAMVQELVGVMYAASALDLKNFDIHSLMAFQEEGETLTQTMERVGGGFIKIQDAFTPVGEKLNIAAGELSDLYSSLTEFGYEVPTTQEGWLKVMKSLDLSSESGRELFSRMLALAGSFDQVENAAAAAMNEFDSLMGRLRPGYTAGLQNAQLGSSVAGFMNANAWTQGMSADEVVASLRTISREDFAMYSASNQQLILTILGLDSTLTGAASDIGEAVHEFVATVHNSLPDTAGVLGDVSNLVGDFSGVFQGEFQDSQPKLIAALGGELAKVTAEINAPGAGQNWIHFSELITKQAALTQAIGVAKDDLNKFWELEGTAPGHGKELLDLNKWFEDSKKLMEGNVPGMLALESEFQRRRTEIMTDSITSTIDELTRAREGLRGWWDGLFQSELSPLTPQQKFEDARAQYEETLKLAQSGDVTAIQDLSGDSDTYLKLARMLFASSSIYTDIFRTVATETGTVAGATSTDINSKLALALPEGSAKMASSEDVNLVKEAILATGQVQAQSLDALNQMNVLMATANDLLDKLRRQGVFA